MWIVHRRHMLDFWAPGEWSGRRADKELFEVFWDDTLRRIRGAGVVELSVNKQLELVQKATFMDMFELDAAIAVTDDDNHALAGALYRGLFQSRDDVDPAHALALADWVRGEVWNVMTQPKEDVYRGWITWSPPLGEARGDRLARQRRLFEGEWRDAVWIDGRVYFWHTVRGTRTTDLAAVPPAELTPNRRWALVTHMRRLRDKGTLPPAYARELEAIEAREEQRKARVAAVAQSDARKEAAPAALEGGA
jgi:hypothetical protein